MTLDEITVEDFQLYLLYKSAIFRNKLTGSIRTVDRVDYRGNVFFADGLNEYPSIKSFANHYLSIDGERIEVAVTKFMEGKKRA